MTLKHYTSSRIIEILEKRQDKLYFSMECKVVMFWFMVYSYKNMHGKVGGKV